VATAQHVNVWLKKGCTGTKNQFRANVGEKHDAKLKE